MAEQEQFTGFYWIASPALALALCDLLSSTSVSSNALFALLCSIATISLAQKSGPLDKVALIAFICELLVGLEGSLQLVNFLALLIGTVLGASLELGLDTYEKSLVGLALYLMLPSCKELSRIGPAGNEFSIQQSLAVARAMLVTVLCTVLFCEASLYMLSRWFKLQKQTYRPIVFAMSMIGTVYYALVPLCSRNGVNNVVHWILAFTFRHPGYYELQLCIYWVILIVIAVILGYYGAVKWQWPRTCNRKIFHALVVAMFAPTLSGSGTVLFTTLIGKSHPSQPFGSSVLADNVQLVEQSAAYRSLSFLVLAMAVAVGKFLCAEYARLVTPRCTASAQREKQNDESISVLGRLQEAGRRVTDVVEGYMHLFLMHDQRTKDSAAVQVELSHISLLVGCAAPIWLYAYFLGLLTQQRSTPAAAGGILDNGGGRELSTDKLAAVLVLSLLPHAGLITLGVGDAAAAVIGKLYGCLRWVQLLPQPLHTLSVFRDNRRTVLGSVACLASMVAYSCLALWWQWSVLSSEIHSSGVPLIAGIDARVACKLAAVVVMVCTVVTLVEAFTTLNDNLLLPTVMCSLLLTATLICFGPL